MRSMVAKRAPEPEPWRLAYAERQLEIARHGLRLGSTALARAALRVLCGEDFADPPEARRLLATLCERADPDDLIDALHRLCALPPASARTAALAAPRAARGTGPAARSTGELRRIEVEAQQAILRHAVRTGQLDIVRRAGRLLRARDFAQPLAVEGPLGVMRDARSSEDELLEAATRVSAQPPARG